MFALGVDSFIVPNIHSDELPLWHVQIRLPKTRLKNQLYHVNLTLAFTLILVVLRFFPDCFPTLTNDIFSFSKHSVVIEFKSDVILLSIDDDCNAIEPGKYNFILKSEVWFFFSNYYQSSFKTKCGNRELTL